MALQKTLEVKINADTSGFQRGLKRVSAGLTSIKSQALSAAKAGLALAGITVGLQQLGESFKSYLSLESSVKRVNDLFADSAKYVQYFAQNAQKGFGLAESAAYQYAAVYGNLFRGITTSSEENAKVTIAMLKTSAVVASKTGRTMDDVMERIRSGLLGNTEAIEDLGIQVNVAMLETTDAFKRLADGRSWEQLEFYEQQQIRTLAILEQAHKAYGDEVTQGSAYSVNGLTSAFSDLQSTMGMFLNAGLQPVIKGLTELVQWANAGLKAIGAYFGLDAQLKASAASSSGNMASDYEATTEAIKDAEKAQRRMVAGFDQVNIITRKEAAAESAMGTSGGISSGVFDSLPELEFSEAERQLPNVVGLLDTFKTKVVEAGQAVRGYFGADIVQFVSESASALAQTIGNIAGQVAQMGYNAISAIGDIIRQAVSLDSVRQIAADIVSTFAAGLFGTIQLGLNIGRDLIYAITEPIVQNKDKILDAIDNTLEPIKTIVESIKVSISKTFAKINEVYTEKISPVIKSFVDGLTELGGKALDMYNEHIAPMLQRLADKWAEMWENHVQPMINKAIELFGIIAENVGYLWEETIKPFIAWVISNVVPKLVPIFELIGTAIINAFGIVADVVSGVIEALGGVITFLTGVFTGDWERAWDGIKSIFSGIWSGIASVLEGVLNACITGINFLIRQLNKVSIKIPDWVPAIGGKNFGFNVTEISKVTLPRLADGGILSTPTAALLAEYPGAMSNPEIAAPQSVIHDTVIEANSPMVVAIVSAIQRLEKTLKEKDMGVYLGDDEIARSAARGNRDHIMRTGKSLIGG